METHFQKQLDQLKIKVLEMASLSEQALTKALRAFSDRDTDLAEEVIDSDFIINNLQGEIDELSLRLLALDQPVASDLRFIVGSMHTIVNLERIGDQAVNISERAILFSQRQPLPHNPLLDELNQVVGKMVRDAVQAYNTRDTALAEKVCEMDARADTLNLKILKHYISYMVEESRSVERAVHMIIISRCLERIGDLATNISEYVLFIVKGVNVKARCNPL